MAVGLPLKTTYADGDVYSASDVNDTNGTINAYLAPSLGYSAGKNKIINGDFYINQRGFSSGTTSGTFIADRWTSDNLGGTTTCSIQTFTPGTAPVTGYEGKQYAQIVTSGQSGTNYAAIYSRIEDVRTLANQTATLSFWAKSASGTPSIIATFTQIFGGAQPSVQTNATAKAITTSWARYTVPITIPSVSGKTIGSSSSLQVMLVVSDGGGEGTTLGVQNNTFSIWGVQLEAGSTATAFQTATGTIQGELAACQRYYFRTQTGTNAGYFGVTVAGSSTTTYANVIMKQTMRTTPTSVDFSGLKWQSINNSGNITAASISDATPENVLLVCTTTGATTGAMNYLAGQSNTAYVGYSAEL
jgi:hypothetical protein